MKGKKLKLNTKYVIGEGEKTKKGFLKCRLKCQSRCQSIFHKSSLPVFNFTILFFSLNFSLLCFSCGSSKSATGDGLSEMDFSPVDQQGDVIGNDLDGTELQVCVDKDGDGRGVGCHLGLDCNDNDPNHWNDCSDCGVTHAGGCPCSGGESYSCYEGPPGTERVGICKSGTRYCEGGYLGVCEGQVLPADSEICGNGVDDDCNGRGDEEKFGPCRNCDPSCHTEGQTIPDPNDPNSEGVMQNPDGPGIVLGSTTVSAGYAWIANSEEGTVSKLRLSDGVEVARYRVGLWGTRDDQPSRTAVDSVGNAYVANRAHLPDNPHNQPSVTKMAGDERFCVDRNRNGVIDTSRGSTPLPLGEDECVIWTVPVGNPGGVARALAIGLRDLDDPNPLSPGKPWVGLWSEMRFLELSPDDGSVLREVRVNVNPYGAAIDHNGWIWISGMRPQPGFIQRFNTRTLQVDSPISLERTGCGSDYNDGIYSPYGIAVDMNDRVWLGSWSANVCRYNPADGSVLTVSLQPGVARGVAVDREGLVWASNYQEGVYNRLTAINADTGAIVPRYDFTISGRRPIGVGVDELGQIWTVNQASSTATRLVKATATLYEHPVGNGPYTYSDFTGYQRSIMMNEGHWYHPYHRCNEGSEDQFTLLFWDVSTPSNSKVTIYGYSAPTEAECLRSTPVVLATIPSDVPPVDIAAKFEAASQTLYEWLGILVVLTPSGDNQSPVVRAVEVQWVCRNVG